jgi:hypothetical protein
MQMRIVQALLLLLCGTYKERGGRMLRLAGRQAGRKMVGISKDREESG